MGARSLSMLENLRESKTIVPFRAKVLCVRSSYGTHCSAETARVLYTRENLQASPWLPHPRFVRCQNLCTRRSQRNQPLQAGELDSTHPASPRTCWRFQHPLPRHLCRLAWRSARTKNSVLGRQRYPTVFLPCPLPRPWHLFEKRSIPNESSAIFHRNLAKAPSLRDQSLTIETTFQRSHSRIVSSRPCLVEVATVE